MYVENEISIYDFVCAISEAIDLVSPVLNDHHKRVAYIAFCIAQEMNLRSNEVQDIVMASMLHDIGAFSISERLKCLSFELDSAERNNHAVLGYMLLKDFAPLSNAAELIMHHHRYFDSLMPEVPIGSYIIHLADRVSVLFNENGEPLEQIPAVLGHVLEKSKLFHPAVVEAFSRLAEVEYLWIEAFSPLTSSTMSKKTRFPNEVIELDTLRDFAKVIAQIIDFRSRFTATHSSGVAAVAHELSLISGFSERECKLMEIAGFLHDLGKLSVPNGILEKPGALDYDEFNAVKKHTYYTYTILNKISGMEHVAAWAAHHHERQDGSGYPFHVNGSDFYRLSRIMAVSDILTALMEDRPYRLGMEEDTARSVLLLMAENGEIDSGIVALANDNFSILNEARMLAQQEALKEYEGFYGGCEYAAAPSKRKRWPFSNRSMA